MLGVAQGCDGLGTAVTAAAVYHTRFTDLPIYTHRRGEHDHVYDKGVWAGPTDKLANCRRAVGDAVCSPLYMLMMFELLSTSLSLRVSLYRSLALDLPGVHYDLTAGRPTTQRQ